MGAIPPFTKGKTGLQVIIMTESQPELNMPCLHFPKKLPYICKPPELNKCVISTHKNNSLFLMINI